MKTILASLLLAAVTASAAVNFQPRIAATNSLAVPPATGYTLKDSISDTGTTYTADMLNWYYFAFPWTASNSYTMRTNVIAAFTGGSPVKDYTLLVYSDNAGAPGTLLSGGTSETRAGSTCPTSEGLWRFGGNSCVITSGQTYWTVVKMSTGGYEGGGNIIKVLLKLNSGFANWKKSDDAASWTDDVGNVMLRFETWGD